MTEASSGYLSSHSLAASRVAPHLRPTPGWLSPVPRKAKIFWPTLVTTPSPHGSSCQAPGLARQYSTSSSQVMCHMVSPAEASPHEVTLACVTLRKLPPLREHSPLAGHASHPRRGHDNCVEDLIGAPAGPGNPPVHAGRT